jgi:trigger factor
LKIEKTPLEDHQIKLTVEVEKETLEQAKQRAARQIAKRTRIPGFRPGKAPYPVILRQIGEAAILEEAIELVVKDVYPVVIDESGIQPYGPGQLENITSMDPPVLEFVVPLDAEVQLGDYHSIQMPYETPTVSDQEVENVLSSLRERQAVIEPVERSAEEGDVVTVRVQATRLNVEEGQEATLIRERSMPIRIRPVDLEESETAEDEEDADKNIEWPFPGFSREFIGMSVGEEKSFIYSYPDDSPYETLRGVQAEFHAVIEEVKSRTLPELNDEFASSLGDYETVDALRAEIRTSLEQQAKDTYNNKYDSEVLDKVVEDTVIKYPPQMLDAEIDSVIENLKRRLAQQNLDLDTYLKMQQTDMEGLRKEMTPVAESRMKRTLVLYELAQAEKVEVGQDELQTETARTLDMLSHSLPEKDARRLSDQNVVSNLVSSIMADMISHKAMERLRSIASGIEPEQNEDTADQAVGEELPGETSESEEAAAENDTQAPEPGETPASESVAGAGSAEAESTPVSKAGSAGREE